MSNNATKKSQQCSLSSFNKDYMMLQALQFYCCFQELWEFISYRCLYMQFWFILRLHLEHERVRQETAQVIVEEQRMMQEVKLLQEEAERLRKVEKWWWNEVNSLCSKDKDRSGSTLAQVMACCFTAPSHYLNQFRFIISKVQCHSSQGNFTRDSSALNYLK